MRARKITKFLTRFLVVCFVAVLVIEGFMYYRPLPSLRPAVSIKTPPAAAAPSLPWPNYGQAALGAEGFGILQTHGRQQPAPIASVAKIMTAYCVLKQKPLAAGAQGTMITITDQDVATYNDYAAKGGSVASVTTGEQISEYQALQAMLLPSANNFADLLANWAFGSLDKYIAYANDQAKVLGLSNTHITDASGFSPQTLSSAQDLVVLGEAAIKNPVIADVVSQQQANVPVAGNVHNVNWMLESGIVNGIKTGDTDQAGGCFLFSAKHTVDGQDITIVGAIISAPALNNAVADSKPLVTAAAQDFKTAPAVKADQTVGYYQPPWGSQTPVVAQQGLSLLTWQGQKIQVKVRLNPLHAPESNSATVGSITASTPQHSTATHAVLSQNISTPSWSWRVFGR